jgi:nitroimidazol reductase NimA-like FMN-containing flavoprotein (pyridoxamine 5'-phosphate oxidase superfamily)
MNDRNESRNDGCGHSSFAADDQNRIRRVPNNAVYDREKVYSILDAALVGQIGFVGESGPVIIPMLFARDGDRLLIHGSTKSRLMLAISGEQKVCFSVTHLDGLVLAKSLFHHSMNYRSVTCFGVGGEVTGVEQRLEALRLMSEKMLPGRWEDARKPSAKEMKATCIAEIMIQSASAKVRKGPPNDDKEDLSLPVWSGILPLRPATGDPIPDQGQEVDLPNYIKHWQRVRD